MNEIFLGYDVNGEKVSIPIFHSVITGLTQTGKTETIKSMAQRAFKEGYIVLLMDVKKKTSGESDFASIGQSIPIYLKETTEPLVLKGLLESDAHFRLNFQFTELIIASETAKSLREVRDNIGKVLLQPHLHPMRKDKLDTLRYLLDRLLEELEQEKISAKLELPREAGIYVMDITKHSESFKQLVVRGIAEDIRNSYTKVIMVLDESHVHVPQEYSSASKQSVVKLLKEGASSEQFVWLADQTISEIDKDPLKQCEVWLIGRQRELNEAEHSFKQLPYKGELKVEDIMRLPLGFFLVSTHEWAKLTYIKPEWLNEDVAIRVAKREIPPSEALQLKPIPVAVFDDPYWETKYNELLAKYNKEKGEWSKLAIEDYEKQLSDLQNNADEQADEINQLKAEVQEHEEERKDLAKEFSDATEEVTVLKADNQVLQNQLKVYARVQAVFEDMVKEIVREQLTSIIKEEMDNLRQIYGVVPEGTEVSLLNIEDNTVKVEIAEKIVKKEASTDTLEGVIAKMIKTGFFNAKKNMTMVKKELFKRGFEDKETEISAMLKQYIKWGFLNHEKTDRDWWQAVSEKLKDITEVKA